MFDFTISIKQGKMTRLGYCSLCADKATTTIGNRKVCEPCKTKWGVRPAPSMQSVIAAEHAAVVAYESKHGKLL